MSKVYKVAACIVTYKSPLEEVREAAHSFLASGVDCHLTVVDNNSGEAYYNQLQQAFEAKFIQSGANGGFGFAHNIGIREASPSEYYLILNPDVIIPEGSLKKMLDYMEANPDIGLLVPQIRFPDGSLQPLNKRLPTVFDLFVRRFLPQSLKRLPFIKRRMDYYIMRDKGYDSIYEVPYATGCFMLFRKSVLEKVGGLDERFFLYLEDADITIRTNQVSKTVYYPHAHVTHIWKRGSYHNIKHTWVMFRSAVYFFSKWGWRWW